MKGKRVAVVTGASSGIGAAIARRLGGLGYCVVLAARRRDKLEAVAQEILQEGASAHVVLADLADPTQIEKLTAASLDTCGKIDVLVNNAGLGRLQWIEDLDPKGDVEQQLQVNLTGTILLTRAVLPHMIERRTGHIINMASMASFIAMPTYTVYAASKFGLRGFTDALRREARIWGIHVTGLYPGSVATEFGRKAGPRRRTRLSTPRWLVLNPNDVAVAVEKVLKRPRPTVILPPAMRLVIWFASHFPGLVDQIVTKRFVRPERVP